MITITITVRQGRPSPEAAAEGADFGMDIGYETKLEEATGPETALLRVIEVRHRELLGMMAGAAVVSEIMEKDGRKT